MGKNVVKVAGFAAVAGLVTSLVSGGAAFASGMPQSSVVHESSGQQVVWVAKDVTKQQGYTIEYKTRDNLTGQLLQDKVVTAPAGSLVAFAQETLAQAKADGLDYIIPSSTQPLSQQLNQLHKATYNRLHSSMAAKPATTSLTVYPNSTSTASGNFNTGFDSGTVNYTVSYTDDPTFNAVNVTGFSTHQTSGTGDLYQDEIDWDGSSYAWTNPCPIVPTSGSLTHSMTWSGTPGSNFYDNTQGSDFMGTRYQAWVQIN